MPQRVFIFFAAWIIGLPVHFAAAGGSDSAREQLMEMQTARADFQVALSTYFAARPGTFIFRGGESQRLSGLPGTKSVAKSVLLSAALPGVGQLYTGSILKGLGFLIIEAAALTGHFYFKGRGNDLENEFELFANQHWFEDVYWDWMSDISGISRNDMDALRDYERANFSHFLPEKKNQQYYENIGKYNQFNIGWDDTNNGGARDSDRREHYTLMRRDANDNFNRATTMVTVVLFNHVLSALDAGWTTRRFNRKIETHLRMKGLIYNRNLVPALTLGVNW